MGFFGWILYIFCGVLFYFAIEFIGNKITLGKVDKIIFLNVFNIIVSGLLFRYSIRYTDNIFLVFVFVMLTDIIYNTYIVDRDFFDNDSGGIYYYIGLVITGFIINQEFINKVNNVFLSGNEFRLVLWLLIIIYFYNLFKNEKIFHRKDSNEKKVMSVNNILNNYAKFKYTYYDDCDHDNKVISNILYAIMIYEDNNKNKVRRNIDNFMFKINGKKNKLGIMQVESKKFISDSESIDIAYKKVLKIYNSTKTKDINKLFDKYYGYNNEDVKYIYEIIKKL